MTNIIRENIVILSQFLREFKTTGEICSSSRWAAETLAYPIRERDRPLRILEVGPGTGAVTRRILQDMKPEDSLVISEINSSFMEVLKKRLEIDDGYQAHKDKVQFVLGPIQEIDQTEPFDVIVCAIPFLNLDVPTIESIFAKLHELSKPETVMTYYEYIALKSIGKVLSPKSRQERLGRIDRFFNQRFGNRTDLRKRVWLNLLPINIYTIQPYEEAA